MSDLLEGVMLSEYQLLECISKSGIADVYRARQTNEGHYEVAVKIFRTGYAQRESFREYFMTEAEKIGQFEHPNILPFLEFGEGEDLLYSVTPLVTTGTLDDLLERVGGKLTAMQALPIMRQLCDAVQYAHEHNVIHGNIKPSNIFVAADGRMLLSDFGIVRGYDDTQQSLTRIGWGSAEYAAPEQSLGVLKRASDIYSMGVLLFRILTGEPPFTGQTPVEVLLKHVRQEAPSARSLDAHISDAVDGVLHMALQKRSHDRFASAEEFSNALAVAVSYAPVASPVAKSVLPILHHAIPENGLASVTDPQTPVPTYSTMTTFNESEDRGSHIYWSTEPVEWSPIGEEGGDSPATATEYLNSKATLTENGIGKPSSVLNPEIEEESKGEEKVTYSRFKNLLPILVVILLVIGLIAALLSSFIIPNSSGSSNTSRNHQIVEAWSGQSH